ncbi:LiaF transmembrane domain-containing protein [Mucilaginibacter myungsuensis]|uniref:Cell wall-active antibiotic response 4TMS protein YvqF n=1 Tax=Mucilaginibacter myungsuensis TaxID=649104 RepID=A0A929L3I6_9SPHI|nr:DUF5668 domain-containing protein [Mucilaginibacter myungsuensis]MBE9662566.1 hypothetical protein [Mucilaginibacter myungsuensis]MDN3597986.1 DUF5668 domain-containing protein [Mucilaginibacter myungsuensis]
MSIDPKYKNIPQTGKAFAGVILLAIGLVYLLEETNLFYIPDWVISFPMFMIALGVYIGAKNDFKRPVPLIIIAIGALSLLDDIFPRADFSRAIWPMILVGVGFWLIYGRKNQTAGSIFGKHKVGRTDPFKNAEFSDPFAPKPTPNFDTAFDPNYDPNAPAADQPAGSTPPPYMGDNHIDTVSVFGGVKRTILSKTFKGGEIVNVFGGTDLDLTQADIQGQVIVEITQLFGGIKLIIPPHWQVTSDVAAVFSSVDDKRRNMGTPLSPDKILVIKGVSIFAGVDIRSF